MRAFCTSLNETSPVSFLGRWHEREAECLEHMSPIQSLPRWRLPLEFLLSSSAVTLAPNHQSAPLGFDTTPLSEKASYCPAVATLPLTSMSAQLHQAAATCPGGDGFQVTGLPICW